MLTAPGKVTGVPISTEAGNQLLAVARQEFDFVVVDTGSRPDRVEDWKSMDKRQYCVYNQTSECFLSLGVTREDRGFARFKGLLRGRAPRYDEGFWLSRPKGVHLLRLFSSRDLVFLD